MQAPDIQHSLAGYCLKPNMEKVTDDRACWARSWLAGDWEDWAVIGGVLCPDLFMTWHGFCVRLILVRLNYLDWAETNWSDPAGLNKFLSYKLLDVWDTISWVVWEAVCPWLVRIWLCWVMWSVEPTPHPQGKCIKQNNHSIHSEWVHPVIRIRYLLWTAFQDYHYLIIILSSPVHHPTLLHSVYQITPALNCGYPYTTTVNTSEVRGLWPYKDHPLNGLIQILLL